MDDGGLLLGEDEDILPPTISKRKLFSALSSRREFEAVNPWQMLKLVVAKATATTLIVDDIIILCGRCCSQTRWRGEHRAQTFILTPT